MTAILVITLLMLTSAASAMAIMPRSSQCASLDALEREWRLRELTQEQKREKARLTAWYNQNCRGKK